MLYPGGPWRSKVVPETCLILEWGECLRRGTDMSKDLCSVGAVLMKTTFQVFTANLMTEF